MKYKLDKKTRERIRKDPAYRIVRLCRELDIEIDGVRVPATAAAILNGIREALNELPEDY